MWQGNYTHEITKFKQDVHNDQTVDMTRKMEESSQGPQ